MNENRDLLRKACDTIKNTYKDGIPQELDGKVSLVKQTNRRFVNDEIYGGKGKNWPGQKDSDPFVIVYFEMLYGGIKIGDGRKAMAIQAGINSDLTKYTLKYGMPDEGQMIKIIKPENSEFWDIDLIPNDEQNFELAFEYDEEEEDEEEEDEEEEDEEEEGDD